MASINEKLNYINETKSLIKDKLNILGSEIEDETTFREYAEKIEDLYEEWPKINDEDTNITLNNTKKGKMELTLKGNTSQDDIPTPSSPIDINTVSGENTITICGKNLAPDTYINKTTTANAPLNYMPCVPSTKYAFSLSQTCTKLGKNSSTYMQHWIKYLNKSREIIRQNSILGSWTFTEVNETKSGTTIITTPADCWYISIDIGYYHANDNSTFLTNYYQLEKNTVATNYEPYQKQTYPINLGTLELCKINDFQDYLYKQSNTWFKKPIILKINNYNEEIITTDYISTTGSLTPGATVYYINPNSNPDGIEITDTILINQLNILEQATSYNNQTNVWQINDNLSFIITANTLLKNSN